MPETKAISSEIVNYNGRTNTGKPKVYSVCRHCGFRDGVINETRILERGKLGSSRTLRKCMHLQRCLVAGDEIKAKYDRNGDDITVAQVNVETQSQSQSNAPIPLQFDKLSLL